MAPRRQFSGVVREGEFEILGEVKTDSKRRILLKGSDAAAHYRIYRNGAGQYVLDPQVMVPKAEAWLYESKEALGSVRKGLQELGARKLRKMKSLARHAEDEIE